MTPRLVPHNFLRHLFPALLSGSLGLVGWWCVVVSLGLIRGTRPSLSPDDEALLWLVGLAGIVAAGQPWIEGRFTGSGWFERGVSMMTAGLFAVLGAILMISAYEVVAAASMERRWVELGLAAPERVRLAREAAASMALPDRIGPFVLAGMASAFGMWSVRAGRHLIELARRRWSLAFIPPAPPLEGGFLANTGLHALAGPTAGVVAAVSWYLCGLSLGDRFVAAALGSWVFGAVLGGLVFAIPERYFVGWMRVLVGARPGWRVPLDAYDDTLSERFVGRYTGGLDVYLPAEDGADELHLTFVAKDDGVWTARGLSQRPVVVRRSLERVDLSYDPERPAPLETPLQDGDRVSISDLGEVELVVQTRDGAP